MSYGAGDGPGGSNQQWSDEHWADHDEYGDESDSDVSAGVIALVAFLTVVVLALLGVVAYLFLRPGGLSGGTVGTDTVGTSDPVPGPTEATSSSPPVEVTTTTSDSATVTVTRSPDPTTTSTDYPVGADRSGWTGNRQARCNAGDPASMIGRTAQASFSICINPDNGRYYYRGSAGGNGIEVDDPVISGNTATVTNNGVVYVISPSDMSITENGAVISDQQMVDFWVR